MIDQTVQARDISQSVVVTGDGNTVTLTFGDSGIVLPLRRRQFRPPDRRRRLASGDPPRELELLVPEAGKLPLIGRKDLFAELQGWIDDEVDISVHALIGRAGSGKTRLAIEFCAHIDSDPSAKGRWLAGFIAPTELRDIVETLATHHFRWERPTLLVIDNAAQCHEPFGRWLDLLVGQKLETKLRILLLDREAPEEFGWWRDLTDPPLDTARERRDLFYSLRPRQLPDLSDPEERRELMIAALHAARGLRSVPADGVQIPPKDGDPDFDRMLAEPQFGNPLALVMAGVIALDRGARAALALRHLETARRLGRRELDRFAAFAESRRVTGDTMRHIVAFNELTGGIPIAELRKSVAEELTASRRSADLDAVLSILEQELPQRTRSEQAASGPRLATIQPDLISEAAIIESFTGEASRESEAAESVRRAYAFAGEDAAHALSRLLQDFGYALEDESATEQERATARRLMDWLLNLTRQVEDPERLLPLVRALPVETTILLEPAFEVTERVATLLEQEAGRTDEATLRNVAWSMNALGIRLGALGRLEEALAAAEKAVGHYRALAEAYPDVFDPYFPLSLTNLAGILSRLDRDEEALVAAEEAVDRHRALAKERPDAVAHNLAMSLTNLAAILRGLDRDEEALVAAEEAVGHSRTLAAARPEAVTEDLAAALNNLVLTLSALGRHEEALTTAEEVVGHYRTLAAARPDAFTPGLARALIGLALRLSDFGQREEALAAAEEAVRRYRALAEAHPDAFTHQLAMSLINLADQRSALGRPAGALVVTEEAVCLLNVLAEANPDAFTPVLATSLNDLAELLSDLGRDEEALRAVEESTHLRRTLAATRPDVFTPLLAYNLSRLALMLRALGRHEEALAAAEEAVRLRHALAAARPDALTPDLAKSLDVLGLTLTALGRREEALTTAEEAVRLYRTLAEARPDALGVDLSRSLLFLGHLYGEVGKPNIAIVALAEGIRSLTPFCWDGHETAAELMGDLVQTYRQQCEAAGCEPDAELLGPLIRNSSVLRRSGA
jgi:tetratricopeptide (TPR) repeat protein